MVSNEEEKIKTFMEVVARQMPTEMVA